MQRRFFRTLYFIAATMFIAGSLPLFAQEPTSPPPPPPPPGTVSVVGPRTLFFSKWIGNRRVVTGKPYSAVEKVTTTRVLGDGNRIASKSTAQVSRDSQGRMRREYVLSDIGPWQSQGKVPGFVYIDDPVSEVHYVWNINTGIAMKWSLAPRPDSMPVRKAIPSVTTHKEPKGGGSKVRRQMKAEALGSRIIGGVLAKGARTTATIPAGDIGNEKPIVTVVERWYAPAIGRDVLEKRTDPFTGERIDKLTNISLKEPDPSLFQVPPGYTVKERPHSPGDVFYMRVEPRPPEQ